MRKDSAARVRYICFRFSASLCAGWLSFTTTFLSIAIFMLVANAGTVGKRAVSELYLLNNVEHWRGRADDARKLAEQVAAAESRDVLLAIAAKYDRIAQRITSLAEGAVQPI
jgi:hypothetical protein